MDSPTQLAHSLYPSQIRLFSGHFVNPTMMGSRDVSLQDIAHGLAHRCRFNGHTQSFYSVAEHCLRVAAKVPAEFKLMALLHDASEAYLFDIPSPVKHLFPQLYWLETQVMIAVAGKFKFTWSSPLPDCIKQADHEALEEEWQLYVLSNHKPRPAHEVREEFTQEVLKYWQP